MFSVETKEYLRMNKYFILLLAALLIAGAFISPHEDEPTYITAILVGAGECRFYYAYLDGEDITIGSLESEGRIGDSLPVRSPDYSHLKCVFVAEDAKTEDIAAFLSFAHDNLPLCADMAVCEPSLPDETDGRDRPAAEEVPKLLTGEYSVSIFEYMNYKKIPVVSFDGQGFSVEWR